MQMSFNMSMICWSSCSLCFSSDSTPSAICANVSAYSLIYSNVMSLSSLYLVWVLIYSHCSSSFLSMAWTSLISRSCSLSSCCFCTRNAPFTFLSRCSAAWISLSAYFFLSDIVCFTRVSWSVSSPSTCARCLSRRSTLDFSEWNWVFTRSLKDCYS